MSRRHRYNGAGSSFDSTPSTRSGSSLNGCAVFIAILVVKCVFDLIIGDHGTDEGGRARSSTRRRRYRSRDRRDYHQWERDSTEVVSVAASDLSLPETDDWDWVRGRARSPYRVGSPDQPRPPSPVHLRSRDRIRPVVAPTAGGSSPWECQICFEEKPRNEFPSRRISQNCVHNERTEFTDCCSSCLERHIISAFDGNMWDDIRCPICNAQLQHEDMAQFAPGDIFERYDTLTIRRFLESSLPNFRWCIGPHCSYGEEHPENPDPVVVCSACGFLACSKHNVGWHSGETCSEYDHRVADGQAAAEHKTRKVIKKIAKRCPGCRRYINKNGGCNHMSCLCGREFCWNCFHDHPGHTPDCRRDFA